MPAEFATESLKDLAKESVVALFKRFKGKKPDDWKRLDNDNVEMKKGDEITTVNANVFNM